MMSVHGPSESVDFLHGFAGFQDGAMCRAWGRHKMNAGHPTYGATPAAHRSMECIERKPKISARVFDAPDAVHEELGRIDWLDKRNGSVKHVVALPSGRSSALGLHDAPTMRDDSTAQLALSHHATAHGYQTVHERRKA